MVGFSERWWVNSWRLKKAHKEIDTNCLVGDLEVVESVIDINFRSAQERKLHGHGQFIHLHA